ncbi:CRAL-TRIO domain-containing protein [Scheffersomyces amazonensis]|uniref:CRAL-TRIO domain-containing protein n=1 Tax=Scheffersomyces amazonensis TaxID=1078765 RepID=UPI00315DB849
MTTDFEKLKQTITSTSVSNEQAKKLQQLIDKLPSILSKLDNPEYDEIFGYRINIASEEYVNVSIRNEILLKFLAADKYDLELATKRIIDTLNWRNEFQPLSAAFEEKFDPELTKLGVITDFGKDGKDNLKVLTWNLYGNIKSPKELFEKYGENGTKVDINNVSKLPGSLFLRWRIGLMERSLALIDFSDSHNNKIGQIHDYKNVSMFKMDPGMKQATSQIIEIFGQNYPELLSIKFFINVPAIMSWVFTFFKKLKIISPETLNKFEVLSGGDLSNWFKRSRLPKEYGGEIGSKSGSNGQTDETIFDIEVSNSEYKIGEYGQVILKRLGDKEIAEINNDVD